MGDPIDQKVADALATALKAVISGAKQTELLDKILLTPKFGG